ncbi:hypothetical protein LZ009_16625 [Ramlibacter sp. XY19]|uniref:hypothetical protein n=1 Tax=Ramlibacter paludis TaxID=2908000 RepID=UPI0023DA248D|nr:hypothetical protein [Ramlibacter paludis]MCG2594403.1 hypothetical protein [Ramlibacter paludis]
MRSALDFSSWHSLLTTLLGLAVVTLIMVGVRLLVMQTVQRRRERENRQINERLRTLIAAYKTLGGSFTGNLSVDPSHLKDLATPAAGSERRRRIRDAVEAALSDIILLGTADQVRLAVAAANDLVAGRHVETGELVVALREFIREALDLEPVAGLAVPRQGPARIAAGGARGGVRASGAEGRNGGGGRAGGGGGGSSGLGGGMAVGGLGMAAHHDADQ